MKKSLLLSLALLPVIGTLCAADFQPLEKPNIILIYSDDHGWADLGEQKVDGDIRTPNLSKLARDGVRFARGYVSAPQCVPSRAGVITGRYQQRFGVEDNNKGPLPLAEVTIAERLKPAGYVSCQVGKWHLEAPPERKVATGKSPNEGGGEAASQPWTQGFDEYFTGQMNSFAASHDLAGSKLPNAPQMLTDKRFRCLWQTDAALSFIGRHTNEPFFLYLAYFTPHTPLESPEPWFSKTPANLPKERRQALAMIAAMDEGVGQIRAKLQATGMETNTLIFFIGDNGAPLKEGAWNGSLNLPLTGEKGMLTDGGVRTPFVAAWPGRIPAGQVYEHPVINLDVAATANALAGLPSDGKLDGVNLMPFVTGADKSAPHETLFWRWRSQASVLEFPWKLILLGNHERYLFNVTSRDGETKNLLVQNPEIVTRLEAKLKTWSATLQPPGLPEKKNEQDNMFFAAHVDKTIDHALKRVTTAKKETAEGETRGWICRGGQIAITDGALVIAPDAGAKPFLTKVGLDLVGPVTVTMRVRAPQGCSGSFAWRTKDEKDFTPNCVAPFALKSSDDWQDVSVVLPVKGTLVHLRIKPPETDHLPAFARIELKPAKGAEDIADFTRNTP